MLNLRGKRAFIAGISDDQGYGWAIAKALAEAGVEIIVGTWAPILKIFTMSWDNGKFDEARKLSDNSLFEIAKVYPLDATFDTFADVPEEVRNNKRYANISGYAISEVCEAIGKDFGKIDIFVHALANGPEVTKPLLETSRSGYLAALSSSTYSFVSFVSHLGPIFERGGSAITLSYIAACKAIPGYGGGMSSAKAALESDTKTLAYEAGKKWGIRVNCISAGPLRSRAARAVGMIDSMISYSKANSPLQKTLEAPEIGHAAAFLTSPIASAITGVTLYVDNGLHIMGLAMDSPSLRAPEDGVANTCCQSRGCE